MLAFERLLQAIHYTYPVFMQTWLYYLNVFQAQKDHVALLFSRFSCVSQEHNLTLLPALTQLSPVTPQTHERGVRENVGWGGLNPRMQRPRSNRHSERAAICHATALNVAKQ